MSGKSFTRPQYLQMLKRVRKGDVIIVKSIDRLGRDYEEILEQWRNGNFDWELMYATVDDYFLRVNGVLWVDTNDKEDRQNSFKYMLKALKQGISMVIYPEGI